VIVGGRDESKATLLSCDVAHGTRARQIDLNVRSSVNAALEGVGPDRRPGDRTSHSSDVSPSSRPGGTSIQVASAPLELGSTAKHGETLNQGAVKSTTFDSLSRLAIRYGESGRWMFHCHILEHAERGMMGELELSAP
jgi:hypothetical protein